MAELAYQAWQRMTGLPWAQAKAMGLTNGSAQQNLALIARLNTGWRPNQAPAPAQQAPAAAPAPAGPAPEAQRQNDVISSEAMAANDYSNLVYKLQDIRNQYKFDDVANAADPTFSNYLGNVKQNKSFVSGWGDQTYNPGQAMTSFLDQRNAQYQMPPAVPGQFQTQQMPMRPHETLADVMASQGKVVQNMSNEEFVDWAYKNLLGRVGEPGGVAGWLQALNSGQKTKGGVVTEFLASPERQQLLAKGAITPYTTKSNEPADNLIAGVGDEYAKLLAEGAQANQEEFGRSAQDFAINRQKQESGMANAYMNNYDQTANEFGAAGLQGGMKNRQVSQQANTRAGALSASDYARQQAYGEWQRQMQTTTMGYAKQKRLQLVDQYGNEAIAQSPLAGDSNLKQQALAIKQAGGLT